MQKIFQTLVHFRYTVKLIEINKIVPKQCLSGICSACIEDQNFSAITKMTEQRRDSKHPSTVNGFIFYGWLNFFLPTLQSTCTLEFQNHHNFWTGFVTLFFIFLGKSRNNDPSWYCLGWLCSSCFGHFMKSLIFLCLIASNQQW